MNGEVTLIPRLKKPKKLLRVAAYARVSRDKVEALHSLSSQVSHYNELIASNTGYIFAGVYADYAYSGTKDNRPEFQKMLEECRKGNIDLILSKSISRFSRNTVTTLKLIQELKELNVDVYFEEECIHTLDPKTEMILSMMSVFAENQAKEVSENMLWRIKMDFLKGKLWGGSDTLGYKIVDRKFVLVPEEAKLVRRIFDLYLSGMGDLTIAKLLTSEGIPTFRKVARWNKSTINCILTNQNYTGDLVLQKTYRKNYRVKTKTANKGQRQMYIVRNDHEPIIDKDTFARAQAIRDQKADEHHLKGLKKIHHEFDDLLICEGCGHRYVFKKGQYQNSYICATYKDYGKSVCPSKQLPERVLKKVVAEVLNIKEFDETVLRKKVEKIIVKNGNLLLFHFKNGTSLEIHWDDPSRRDSWNETNKALARNRAIARGEPKRGENGKWQK